jgi:hypothetical protein
MARSRHSDEERSNAGFRGHEPHEAPGQRLFECLAVEVVFFRRMQRHHPASVVDVPGARASAGGASGGMSRTTPR